MLFNNNNNNNGNSCSNSKVVQLKYSLYIPQFRKNLISISNLNKHVIQFF